MGVSVAPRFYQQELEVGSFFSSSFLALAHQLRVGAQSEWLLHRCLCTTIQHNRVCLCSVLFKVYYALICCVRLSMIFVICENKRNSFSARYLEKKDFTFFQTHGLHELVFVFVNSAPAALSYEKCWLPRKLKCECVTHKSYFCKSASYLLFCSKKMKWELQLSYPWHVHAHQMMSWNQRKKKKERNFAQKSDQFQF